jgi:DNA-binding NarL/FixJ family response regulator
MSREARPGTAIVVAQDSMYAARIEAALRGLVRWRIDICTPRQVQGLFEERTEAIVVIVLPDAQARRLLRTMRAWPRAPAIIVLSDDPGAFWTPAFRTLGLRAALPLRATARELAAAVVAVRAGLLVLHAEALAPARAGDATVAVRAPLTSREREILELMADGANNRIIASRLAISRHTVKFHVASILAKLGARGRTEAVALALRRGLVAV